MKILFTLRFFPKYGGGETVTISLANKFARKGHDVHVLYLWNTGECNEIRPEIKLFQVENIGKPKGKESIRSCDFNKIQIAIENYVKSNSIEYIINQWIPPQVVYRANQNRAKIINCRHTAVYIHSKKWNFARKALGERGFRSFLRLYYSRFIENGDKFVLLCKQYEIEMQQIFNNKKNEKITSILNPCRYTNVIRQTKKEKVVIYVGRIYKEKRIDILLYMWKLLEEYVQKNEWWFYIIGDGEKKDELKKYAQESGLKNICFLGYQDPEEYYKKAQLFVSASSLEGYPMTIVEASSFGCIPVIANTYTAALEVANGENGIAITDATERKFADEILSLMNNDEKREKMAEKAISFGSRHNIDKVSEDWEKLFKNLCKTTQEGAENVHE